MKHITSICSFPAIFLATRLHSCLANLTAVTNSSSSSLENLMAANSVVVTSFFFFPTLIFLLLFRLFLLGLFWLMLIVWLLFRVGNLTFLNGSGAIGPLGGSLFNSFGDKSSDKPGSRDLATSPLKILGILLHKIKAKVGYYNAKGN